MLKDKVQYNYRVHPNRLQSPDHYIQVHPLETIHLAQNVDLYVISHSRIDIARKLLTDKLIFTIRKLVTIFIYFAFHQIAVTTRDRNSPHRIGG